MDSSGEIFDQRHRFCLAYPGEMLSNVLDDLWFCLLDTSIVGIFPLPFFPGTVREMTRAINRKLVRSKVRLGSHIHVCSAAAR